MQRQAPPLEATTTHPAGAPEAREEGGASDFAGGRPEEASERTHRRGRKAAKPDSGGGDDESEDVDHDDDEGEEGEGSPRVEVGSHHHEPEPVVVVVALRSREAEEEIRASMCLTAADRPIAVADLGPWYAQLTGDPRPACPARALVGLLQCPAVIGSPEALRDLLQTVADLCSGRDEAAALARTALGRTWARCVACELFTAIGNLADGSPENSSAFGDAGVVAPLVALLRNINLTTSDDVAYELFTAIDHLSDDNPENCRAFGDSGVVTLLVELLRSNPALTTSNPDVALALLGAIGTLALDAENSDEFGRAGVAETLVLLLRSNPNLTTSNQSHPGRGLGSGASGDRPGPFGIVQPDHRQRGKPGGLPATRPLIEQLLATCENDGTVAQGARSLLARL
ncbi:hypothetical protein PAPYR_4846 [Paratrimastix pyriformis]|uniref:Wings apart-like protein C-terminal domain-containing protein n=1 Tax=Paratrimastix pyriformis TaxID=342808 RepID=A0ABQ8UJ92_9EUKA|nr:hypothetical protein PAPYR_4846 [Paratrimastix pyriformis]